MKNTDHNLHELHRQLNDPNFQYPQLPMERENWYNQEAREVRDLREQQERNWWLDKQYEWMKKYGKNEEDSNPEQIIEHLENAKELKECKIDPEESSSNPFEMILFMVFLILLFLSS